MKDIDASTSLRTSLDRLLRAAAQAKDESPAAMPFGFDTRVIALSRRNGNGPALAGLLRRVGLAAAAVIVLASAGAWLEFNQSDDVLLASGNEFAIADSAIQDEVAP
ncbi:MAG TPA: hypothetical protein VHS08_07550 [Candidatus Acidoferrales bacterium]|jgi:hypothetical protein|nr:hypothetical protein [Candidatus Acidoferrales bacterium]